MENLLGQYGLGNLGGIWIVLNEVEKVDIWYFLKELVQICELVEEFVYDWVRLAFRKVILYHC